MDSNTSSTELPVALGPLASAVEALAEEDLTRLPDAHAAQRVLALRSLLERLEGQWLRELAAVDARGAAGAEQGVQAPSTAGWLRRRAGWSPTWPRSPTPTPPMRRPSGSMGGAASGCRQLLRELWRWTGCWTPRPAPRCWRRWSRWPAPP